MTTLRSRLLIRSEADPPEAVAATHAEGRRAVLRLLATAIERGIADGSFRMVDARIAALGILGQVNWMAWWFNSDTDDLDAISIQLAEAAVAGIVDHEGRPVADGPHATTAALRSHLDRLERTLRS